jgi:hypothetical protein
MAVLQTDSKCSNTYVYARIHDFRIDLRLALNPNPPF